MEKDYHYTGYHSNLKPIARTLRKNMTRQERHLWYDYLRNKDVRFLRQKIIGSYIVDFYCAKANLVIELDGSQHYTEQGKAYDEERSAILHGYGLKVLRFSNRDVNNHFDAVCETIDREVQIRI